MTRLLTLSMLLMTLVSSPMFAYETLSSPNNVKFIVDPRKNLQCRVRIPEAFSKHNNITQLKSFGMEYIQGHETWENWTEIITVMEASYNSAPELKEFLAIMEAGYHQRRPKELIECHSSTHKECGRPVAILSAETAAELVIVENPPREAAGYIGETIPNTNEIVLTKIIEGSNNIVIIQYSKRYVIDKTTLEEKAKMKEKMLGFLKNCRVADR